MDPITRMVAAGAAGASGGSATYVDDVFSTTLYTSNASSNFDGTEQVITTGIDHTEGFLTWIKNRDDNYTDHVLFDSERIGTNYKWIYSNDNKKDQDTADIFKSPTSTGFTVKQATSGSGTGRTNPSGSKKMVSWSFRKCPGFFDVVTYIGNGGTQNIAHSLGSEPGMILIKRTDDTDLWTVYHRSLGNSDSITLNATSAKFGTSEFNSTSPTSTVFTVATSDANADGGTYVAYIFAHDNQSFGTNSDQAIIKCGTYTGNGQASGTAVDLGFEPQWVMVKGSVGTESSNWVMQNTMTGMNFDSSGNGETVGNGISANTDFGESGFSPNILATSTGFKALNTSNYTNGNGVTYIYMAIRRPNKPPEAGTDVFAVDTKTAASGNTPQYTSNFPVDFAIRRNNINSQDSPEFVTRLTNALQYTNSTNAEVPCGTAFTLNFGYNTGWGDQASVDSTDYLWMFKRAPGFMDVVAYNGSGTAGLIPHNLGAVPQMIIVKRRNGTPHWQHWYYSLGAGGLIQTAGSTPGGAATTRPHWNNTLPTETHFSVGTDGDVNNSSGTYIAYLFGSLNGISKVGEYTGTGSNVNVDCGFAAGARFVMIKRHDAAGGWYFWDTARGIQSGLNDPYLLFNSTAAEVTNTNYIDSLNVGFTVTSSAPATLNANGGSYLFLAIA